MLELLVFLMFASRVYQMCGHLHYLFNLPIKSGFQKTRGGHILLTIYDGITFVADASLLCAHFVFISLAVGHLAVALLQAVAWDIYCRRFFDVLLARSYYSDGLHVLRRLGLLAYDLAGQAFSFTLLVSQLKPPLMVPALMLGLVSYLAFTPDFRFAR
jgi:hypothetical protein